MWTATNGQLMSADHCPRTDGSFAVDAGVVKVASADVAVFSDRSREVTR